jgi:predicted enzyme related to lactoylglutathione lyase
VPDFIHACGTKNGRAREKGRKYIPENLHGGAMASPGNNHRVDYVEINVRDVPRAKTFYGAAFGWTFKDYGPDYCEFNDGRLRGGFTLGTVKKGGPLVILYATDLEGTQEKVEKAGGKIAKPIFSFPGGRRFQFTDPEGYELGVWSDK